MRIEMSKAGQRIQAFYDEYHRSRGRKAPGWMSSSYWNLFEGRTLEIGPGTLVPQKLSGVEYVAVEYSPVGARILAEKGVEGVVIGDGQCLPFREHGFDVVACHDVLEHVLDPHRLLSEMARVSKGKIIIVGPNYVGPSRKRRGKLQPMWRRFLGCLLGRHRKIHYLKSPRFIFDEEWESDHDAISGVNVWWVVHQLKQMGFSNVTWRTHDGLPNGRLLRRLPFYGLVGFMMFVVASRV